MKMSPELKARLAQPESRAEYAFQASANYQRKLRSVPVGAKEFEWRSSQKKPTQLVASDSDLVYYFRNLRCGRFPNRCSGNHSHLTGREAYAARIWPWEFARRLAWGVVRLMKRKHWQHQRQGGQVHYPTVQADAVERIACRQNRPRDHVQHTRVPGSCRFPDDCSVGYGCPACRKGRPYSHPEHTDHADGPLMCRRHYRRARTGQTSRVREPRAHQQPLPHCREDERLVRPPEPHGALQPDAGQPRVVDLPDGDGDSDDDDEIDETGNPTVDPTGAEAPPLRPKVRSGNSRNRRHKLKHSLRQVRRRDIGTPIAPPHDADERDETWSAMGWKKVLKELNDPNINIVKRRLRRIHLRWYHATASRMIRLLEMIGCPESTLKLIPDIAAACRVCRTCSEPLDVKVSY